jgi:hypothetical protein
VFVIVFVFRQLRHGYGQDSGLLSSIGSADQRSSDSGT